MPTSPVRLVDGARHVEGAGTAIRVLLCAADDERRAAMAESLRADGCDVLETDDLARLRPPPDEPPPDVALCALTLLPGAGRDLSTYATDVNDSAIVLLVEETRGADSARGLAAMEHGAYDYLVLPCSADALTDVVRRAARFRAAAVRERRVDELTALERARLDARRAQLEAELATAERLDEPQLKLVNLVVHDLKNQVAVIRSNLSYVLEEPLSEGPRGLLLEASTAVDLVLGSVVAIAERPAPASDE